jgi:hypothetical protein
MQSILVLYLSTYLFQAKAPEEIWLLATVAQLFEINGQALASAVTGGYLMAVSITPLIGGWLTDYKLGPHKAVIVGGKAMAVYLSTAKSSIQTPVQSVDTIAKPAKQDWLFVVGIVAAVGLSAIPNLQLFNAYLLWAERDVDLQLMGNRMPTSWLIGIDALLGLCVLAGAMIFAILNSKRKNAGGEA